MSKKTIPLKESIFYAFSNSYRNFKLLASNTWLELLGLIALGLTSIPLLRSVTAEYFINRMTIGKYELTTSFYIKIALLVIIGLSLFYLSYFIYSKMIRSMLNSKKVSLAILKKDFKFSSYILAFFLVFFFALFLIFLLVAPVVLSSPDTIQRFKTDPPFWMHLINVTVLVLFFYFYSIITLRLTFMLDNKKLKKGSFREKLRGNCYKFFTGFIFIAFIELLVSTVEFMFYAPGRKNLNFLSSSIEYNLMGLLVRLLDNGYLYVITHTILMYVLLMVYSSYIYKSYTHIKNGR
jgi:hypothetical protein